MFPSYFQLFLMACCLYYYCSPSSSSSELYFSKSSHIFPFASLLPVCTRFGPSLHLHVRSDSGEDLIVSLAPRSAGPVVKQQRNFDCLPPMMKRQGETKAAPRAADVDAGSCFSCEGVKVEVTCFGVNMQVCVWLCINTSCAFSCTCMYCMRMCVSVMALQLWGTQLGRRVSAFIPALKGPGATQVPTEGMKGCTADVTRWGSVA